MLFTLLFYFKLGTKERELLATPTAVFTQRILKAIIESIVQYQMYSGSLS